MRKRILHGRVFRKGTFGLLAAEATTKLKHPEPYPVVIFINTSLERNSLKSRYFRLEFLNQISIQLSSKVLK
jgi:hypothetical protein